MSTTKISISSDDDHLSPPGQNNRKQNSSSRSRKTVLEICRRDYSCDFHQQNPQLEELQLALQNEENTSSNTLQQDGAQALSLALQNHASIEVLQLLLEHVNTNIVFGSGCSCGIPDGLTLLHIAITENASEEVIKLLLEHGADVNASDLNGKTPLHEAVCEGVAPSGIQLLLQRGANVHATNKKGWTTLHFLVGRGINTEETLKLLFLRHCNNQIINVNAINNEMNTPLHLAVMKEASIETVQLLLKNGADPTLRNKEKRPPLYYCTRQYAADMKAPEKDNLALRQVLNFAAEAWKKKSASTLPSATSSSGETRKNILALQQTEVQKIKYEVDALRTSSQDPADCSSQDSPKQVGRRQGKKEEAGCNCCCCS